MVARGDLCVIDWKTSKRRKSSLRFTYDNPLQLAAYAGALNFDTRYDLKVTAWRLPNSPHANWNWTSLFDVLNIKS